MKCEFKARRALYLSVIDKPNPAACQPCKLETISKESTLFSVQVSKVVTWAQVVGGIPLLYLL